MNWEVPPPKNTALKQNVEEDLPLLAQPQPNHQPDPTPRMDTSSWKDRPAPHNEGDGSGYDRTAEQGNAIAMNDDTDTNDDDPVVEVVACPDCDRLVPPANLQMHQLRGCPVRATQHHRHDDGSSTFRRPQQQQQQPAATETPRGAAPPPQNPEYRAEVGSNTATGTPPVPVVAGRIVSNSSPPPTPLPLSMRTTTPHVDARPPFSAALGGVRDKDSSPSNSPPPDDASSSSPWDSRWSGALHTAFGCCTDGGTAATGDSSATATTAVVAAAAAPTFGGDSGVDGMASSYPAARRQRRRQTSTATVAPMPPATDIVNLVDDSPVATAGRHDVIDLMDCDDNDNDAAWACPRCTLLNPDFQAVCEACLYSRRNAHGQPSGADIDNEQQRCGTIRPPDATRTDTLVVPTFLYRRPDTHVAGNDNDDEDHYYHVPPPPPRNSSSYVPSATLLGGVLGAAGAFARGRPVARGALDGAMGGAMGGMAVDAVVAQQQRERDRSAQQLRSSRARSQSNNDNNNDTNNNNRVHVFHTPHGVVTVSTRSSSVGGPARTYAAAAAAGSPDHHLTLDALFHQSLLAALSGGGQGLPLVGGGGGAAALHQHNPDGMTYDQLLQHFGDGTDNLGATPSQIASLPTLVLSQDKCGPGQPPAERCSICLQDFGAGEKCKTLPCWHSAFHADCIDQWLRTNAACPICKHRLE